MKIIIISIYTNSKHRNIAGKKYGTEVTRSRKLLLMVVIEILGRISSVINEEEVDVCM